MQAFRSDPLRRGCRAALRHSFHGDRSRAPRLRLAAPPGQFACDRSSGLAAARQLHRCRNSLCIRRGGPGPLRSAAHGTPRRPCAHRRSGHRADRLGTVRHRLRWRPRSEQADSCGADARPLRDPGLCGHTHRRPGQRRYRGAQRGLPLGLLLGRIEHGDGGQYPCRRRRDQRSIPRARQKRYLSTYLDRSRTRMAERFVASRPISQPRSGWWPVVPTVLRGATTLEPQQVQHDHRSSAVFGQVAVQRCTVD
jgi:hypothetical protein